MTHDELLKVIDTYMRSDRRIYVCNALLAVVELHKPDPDYNVCIQCEYITELTGGGLAVPYPCPTIQAIEEDLSHANV